MRPRSAKFFTVTQFFNIALILCFATGLQEQSIIQLTVTIIFFFSHGHYLISRLPISSNIICNPKRTGYQTTNRKRKVQVHLHFVYLSSTYIHRLVVTIVYACARNLISFLETTRKLFASSAQRKRIFFQQQPQVVGRIASLDCKKKTQIICMLMCAGKS